MRTTSAERVRVHRARRRRGTCTVNLRRRYPIFLCRPSVGSRSAVHVSWCYLPRDQLGYLSIITASA